MNTALAPQAGTSLVTKFATRFGVEPNKLLTTLKVTAFKQSQGKEVSNEQMMALLIVADQYGLNPWTKEIFAFDDKHKGIIPVVSVDGWARIVNEHPQFDGVEYRYADQLVTMPDGKPCPEWCESVFYRKDRSRPIIVREYLDEVYIGPRGNPPIRGPWQTHTKRFLRHKAFIQGARIAFGYGGIHDEDEASRIIEGEAFRVQPTQSAEVADLQERLTQRAQIAADDGKTIDVDTSTGEVLGHAQQEAQPDQAKAPSKPTALQTAIKQLNAAKNRDALDTAMDLYGRDGLSEEGRETVKAAYEERCAEFDS